LCEYNNIFGMFCQAFSNLSDNGIQDQPWSAQDERQIRGRAHRQPQKKEVLVIHLLANNTADIVLSGMARGKHDMMEAFLSKQSNQGRLIK
jgi:SNF2 family DNA or RNA helicase